MEENKTHTFLKVFITIILILDLLLISWLIIYNESNKLENGDSSTKKAIVTNAYSAKVIDKEYVPTKEFITNDDLFYILEFQYVSSGVLINYKWYKLDDNNIYKYFFGGTYTVTKNIKNKSLKIYLDNDEALKNDVGKYKIEVDGSYRDRNYFKYEELIEVN